MVKHKENQILYNILKEKVDATVHQHIYKNALLANYNPLPVAGHWWVLEGQVYIF
ncbi:hypothetical protein HanXRQr2_Chr01g0025021 [Helianthus annuus]|uniref:Uncharacterized protein n=1 Tax=Helianthus annuus TaxID=4232 RepID=A0A251VQ03_HELAN|nr:hypothetical protein HanXRQr2_Chr01g0025021 [Helianthus annuus]KAJ0957176.1 hypothetical protein HanPSC8_Chr01g0024151 [Helianthus annuus]